LVNELNLPDCWIAAGFVRNAVWDHLHGLQAKPIEGDVDVIWFDPQCLDPTVDRKHEEQLRTAEPSICWSVKNQARMHLRNGDSSYHSAVDAMRYWPETATAVAARRLTPHGFEFAAPLGLEDLFNLILRPTERFVFAKRSIYEQRIREKDWLHSWPRLSEKLA
jgi:hypothetical protein